jgi:hypothetical protein
MRWVGHVARLEKRIGAYRVLVGKHAGDRSLERPRHREEDNNYISTSQTTLCIVNKIKKQHIIFGQTPNQLCLIFYMCISSTDTSQLSLCRKILDVYPDT